MPDNADKPTPPRTSEQVSTDRRGFFAQILGLGVDGAEHIGRRMGRRFGDAFQTLNPEAHDDVPTPPPATDNVPRSKGGDQLDL